ncbi:MAG TPA: gamma-glutamyltransferase, partial [Allocoleopsis sp.]
HIGLGSMAVPGTLAGLFHVHERLGNLPRSVVVEPAIHYAKTGVEVSPFQAYCFKILSPILLASQAARQIYAPTGIPLQVGDWLKMPDLAQTLDYLSKTGINGFYRGEIAQQLVRSCEEQGGYLTQEDLENYEVIERQPLKTMYRGKTCLTNPPPSTGGTLIAFALSLLSQVELGKLEFGSIVHRQILADVMRLTNQARSDKYDSRIHEVDVAERFLAASHLEPYAQSLTANLNKWGSTTHISAIDTAGNAASVTTSNGEGSSYIIPGTGVMVNNMLGEADLHPNGFHQWQKNVRISSMMAPTIILDQQQRAEIVLGSGGSNRIRTAILQVISNLIDFDMSIESAVNSPRIHWEATVFSLEPHPNNLMNNSFPFDGQVEHWQQQNMFFGGVHAVARDLSGQLCGAGDPRREGAVAILN